MGYDRADVVFRLLGMGVIVHRAVMIFWIFMRFSLPSVLPAIRCHARLTVVSVMLIHCTFVVGLVFHHSPATDEPGHLAAGMSHWQLQRFDLYCVNPPLVRSVATLPLFLFGERVPISQYHADPIYRAEFRVADEWMSERQSQMLTVFRVSRLMCLPWTILGALACYFWARDLYGFAGGRVALCLWCFNPTICGHASLLMPDVAASALAVASTYRFWKWMRKSSWRNAAFWGVLLGLGILAKLTLLVLPLIWAGYFVGCWLVSHWLKGKGSSHQTAGESHAELLICDDRCEVQRIAARTGEVRKSVAQFVGALMLAWWVVNTAYFWEGSFKPLGEFAFRSRMLSGHDDVSRGTTGNRFEGTLAESIPFPGPANLLRGIDYIKFEYDRGYRSYLRGEKIDGGWWFYYLYGLLVKTPVTILVLFVWTLLSLFRSVCSWRGTALAASAKRATCSAELLILVTVGTLLVLVSSQTGFNHHLRYALPAVPFLGVLAGRLVADLKHGDSVSRAAVTLLLFGSLVTSLWSWPHHLSYFNVIAGGPANGWKHLDRSSLDWGQDLLLLKDWQVAHPECQPLYVSVNGLVDPSYLGIQSTRFSERPHMSEEAGLGSQFPSGWYAIGFTKMVDPITAESRFLNLQPIERVGWTIQIYRIPAESAD